MPGKRFPQRPHPPPCDNSNDSGFGFDQHVEVQQQQLQQSSSQSQSSNQIASAQPQQSSSSAPQHLIRAIPSSRWVSGKFPSKIPTLSLLFELIKNKKKIKWNHATANMMLIIFNQNSCSLNFTSNSLNMLWMMIFKIFWIY